MFWGHIGISHNLIKRDATWESGNWTDKIRDKLSISQESEARNFNGVALDYITRRLEDDGITCEYENTAIGLAEKMPAADKTSHPR